MLGAERVGLQSSCCLERIYQCEACFGLNSVDQDISPKFTQTSFTDSQAIDLSELKFISFCPCGYPNIIEKVYREKYELYPLDHPGYSLSFQQMLLILGKNEQDYANHIYAELLQIKRKWAGKHISTSMVHKFINDSLQISHAFPSKSKKLKPNSAIKNALRDPPAQNLDMEEMKRYYLLCSLMKIITNAEDRLFSLKHNLIKCEFSKNEANRLQALFGNETDARKNCILTFAHGILGEFQVGNAAIEYIASSSLDSNYLKNGTTCVAAQSFLKKIHKLRLSKQKTIEETIMNNLELISQEICLTLAGLENLVTNQLLPTPSTALGALQINPSVSADSSIKRLRYELEKGCKQRSELLDKLNLLFKLYKYARQ